MFIVVVGAGGIGQTLARTCLRDGHDVLVMDRDERRCEEVTRQMDCIAVHGDATRRDVLEEAEVERADAVVTTTSQDAVNLMVIAHAKDLGVPSLVSVVNEASSAPMFHGYGANVVGDPDLLAAEVLYRAIRRPHVKDFMPVGADAEIFKVTVSKDSPVAGTSLKEARMPPRTLVVAIERGDDVHVPSGGTVLQAGDGVTVLASGEGIGKVLELLAPGRGEKAVEGGEDVVGAGSIPDADAADDTAPAAADDADDADDPAGEPPETESHAP